MRVTLDKVGKKFLKHWIFRDLDLTFEQGHCYGISGPNGSGKSTVIQILSGSLSPSSGNVKYTGNGNNIHVGDVFKQVSMAAPYLELVEEFTLNELMKFHFKLKPPVKGVGIDEVPAMLLLEDQLQKQIQHFSSGMKQRLMVGLAILTKSNLLLLDEPTANLDATGIEWFNALLTRHLSDRLVVVASNQTHDFVHCKEVLNMHDLKTNPS